MKNPPIMKTMPNYYAIIPAFIRYDNNLTYLERILYAEITALSNRHGYCYASNKYFSDNFGNSDRTISRSISKLEKLNYITLHIENKVNRKIFIVPEKSLKGMAPTPILSEEKTKMSSKGSQKRLHNSIKSNSILNNTTGEDSLPVFLGKTAHIRLARLYEIAWKETVGTDIVVDLTGIAGITLKRLLTRFSEPMVGMMIFLHFDWRGASGSDNNIHKKLADSGYPIAWIPNGADIYQVFIMAELGVETDEDAIDSIDKLLIKLGYTK